MGKGLVAIGALLVIGGLIAALAWNGMYGGVAMGIGFVAFVAGRLAANN